MVAVKSCAKEKLIAKIPDEETRFTNLPDDGEAGTVEVSLFPFGSAPSSEQQQKADELYEQSLKTVKENGWFNFENAVKDGYIQLVEDELHYWNLNYTFDGETLNPQKPEMIIYYDTEKGKRLAGFMYTASTATEYGPQPGGPLTVWHYHTAEGDLCFKDGLIQKECPNKLENLYQSPEMLHVWFIDHRNGTFGSSMDLYDKETNQLLESKFD